MESSSSETTGYTRKWQHLFLKVSVGPEEGGRQVILPKNHIFSQEGENFLPQYQDLFLKGYKNFLLRVRKLKSLQKYRQCLSFGHSDMFTRSNYEAVHRPCKFYSERIILKLMVSSG
jgi:hypothetical protein